MPRSKCVALYIIPVEHACQGCGGVALWSYARDYTGNWKLLAISCAAENKTPSEWASTVLVMRQYCLDNGGGKLMEEMG